MIGSAAALMEMSYFLCFACGRPANSAMLPYLQQAPWLRSDLPRCKAFADMKGYYNDITHNNLDLIKSLKDDVAAMKRKEAANEKLMYEIAQENKRLAEPLSRALKVGNPTLTWYA